MTKNINLTFLIIIFGFIIRFTYAIFSHDFWLDESLNFRIAQNSPPEIIKALSFDNWPPLYPLLMHYWQQLGTSILFLRLPSVVFGTLTLIVIYKIAKKLFDKKIAIIALILAAVSPPLVYFSAENRGYAFFTFLTSLTILTYINLSKRTGLASLVLFTIAATLALYTHYLAGLLLICLPIVSFLTKTFQVKFNILLSAYLSILILAGPWLAYALPNTKPDCLCASAITGFFTSMLFITIGGGGFVTLKKFFEPETPLIIRATLVLFALITTYFFAKGFSRQKPSLWLYQLFTAPIAFLFFASLYKPLFSIRSLIFLVPILLIATSTFLSKGNTKFIVVGFLIILFTTSQKPFFNYEPLEDMSKNLKTYEGQNIQIIHSNLYTYLPSIYYLPQLDQKISEPDLPQPLIASLNLNIFDPTQHLEDTHEVILVYALDRTDNRKLQNLLNSLYRTFKKQNKDYLLGKIRIIVFQK